MVQRRGQRTRKRERKSVPRGCAYIKSTFNNTMITLTDPNGNVLSWGSAGTANFKGSRTSTPFAAQMAAGGAGEPGRREVGVFVRGRGRGREAAIRALQASGLNVLSIRDVTPIPHNGCRPPTPRPVIGPAGGETRGAT